MTVPPPRVIHADEYRNDPATTELVDEILERFHVDPTTVTEIRVDATRVEVDILSAGLTTFR